MALPFRPALAALLLVALAGCDSGGSTDDPDGPGGGSDLTVAVTAGGERYETETVGAIRSDDGDSFTFGVTFDEDDQIGMVLTAPLAVGTHAAGDGVSLIFNTADNSFYADGSPGTGTVRITSVSGDVVRGTFEFDAVSVDGTSTPLDVTDGEFEVEITVG